MKTDKETLKKQHFWILLGVVVPIILVAVVGIFGVADASEEKKDAIEGAKSELASAPAEGRSKLQGYAEQKEVLDKKRGEIWDKLWNAQADMYALGKAFDDLPELQTLNFGDPISEQTRDQFRKNKKYYADLYENLGKMVAPTDFLGDWVSILQPVGYLSGKPGDWTKVPSSEEVWLALEDYWVRREVIEVVDSVNDSIGHFQRLDQFERVDQRAEAFHRTFRTPQWEMDLQVTQEEESGAKFLTAYLTNLTERALPGGEPFGTENAMAVQVSLRYYPPAEPAPAPMDMEETVDPYATPDLGTEPEAEPVPTGPPVDLDLPLSITADSVLPSDRREVAKIPLSDPALANVAATNIEITGLRFDQQFDPRHRRFRSRLWELDLQLVDQGADKVLKGTLTNVSGRRLRLGENNSMVLKVTLDPNGRVTAPFAVQGESVAAGQTITVPAIKEHTLQPEIGSRAVELAGVDQVFDATTVPVKRIDALELFKPSARTIQFTPLKMTDFSTTIVEEQAAEVSSTTSTDMYGGGSMPSGGSAAYDDAGSGDGYGTGAGVSSTAFTEEHRLQRERYIATTNQVRRMPVAVKLVVDQVYLQDVLIAFANSQLRFENTQYHWQRHRGGATGAGQFNQNFGYGSGGYSPDDTGSEDGDMDGGFEGGFGSSGFGGSAFGPSNPGGFGGPMGSGGYDPTGVGAGNTTRRPPPVDRSLIALSLYGTASLYKPKPTEEEVTDDSGYVTP